MEPSRTLPRKPLVEAILEAHWGLQAGPQAGFERDPHYKFLLGSLLRRVREKYPHHEELPTAAIPEEMTPRIVHHRFRAAPGGWPLIQVGPGVFTVNDTQGYTWESFQGRINEAVPMLIESYPEPDALRFQMLMLRYINALALDPSTTNVLAFLKDKMGTMFSLPASVFEAGRISEQPDEYLFQVVLPCGVPKGVALFKFASGTNKGAPALVFELWFRSQAPDVPPMPHGFSAWASAAHSVIEDSFFHLVEGDLLKEFEREL